MTPANNSAPHKRTSGNPATQADIALTVKQQREQKRREKLAEYQRQLEKRRRGRLVWWGVGVVAALAVVGIVVASFVFAPQAPPQYEAGGTGAEVSGVERFENDTDHVEGAVDYPQSPPAGGPHNNAWLNCGLYGEPQQNEYAVHSLEHGAVWVTYDPARVVGDELSTLRAQLPSSYVILSPYDGLEAPIVLSAWNTQLRVDAASDERIPAFLEEYWRNQNAPEPTAPCTGAIDGEGRL